MILRRHVLRLVGSRVLAALAVLVAILQILDLLDVTTDILQRKLGVAGVAYYALLRTPTLIEQVAPLSVLAGCIFAFAQLARENAVVALRSTGVSTYQLVAMIAPVALSVLLVDLACAQYLGPHAEQRLEAWWAASAPRAEADKPQTRSFRVGPDIVVATQGDHRGRQLRAVSIYRRDAEGRLVQRTKADTAIYAGAGRWRLLSPSVERLGPAQVEQGRAAEIAWQPGPQPQDVRTIFSGEDSVAPGSAHRALSGGLSVRPPAFYQTALQRSWAAPLAALVMLLLAGPVLLINFRSGGARAIVSCLSAGLVFLVVDGVFTALGQGGNIPAVLGAWAAPAIFAAAGASALLFLEG